MSGSIASRYIGGVPYGPSMGVSRYAPQAANLPPASPIAQPPPTSVTPPVPDVTLPGGGVAPGTGSISSVGGVGGGGGMNLLAMLPALLGAVGALPDVYNAARDLFGGAPGVADPTLPTPPEFLTPEQAFDLPRTPETEWAADATIGPWDLPVVPFGGSQFGWVPPGSSPWSAPGTEGVIWSPQTPSFGEAGAPVGGGWVHPSDLGASSGLPGNASAVAAPATVDTGLFGGATSFFNPLGIPDLIEYGNAALGTFGGVPLEAGGISAATTAIMRQAGQSLAKPGGEMGATIGSTLGGVAGMFTGPLAPIAVPVLTLLGGAAGGQIGPAPTIGRNFSGFGSFDPTGNIGWAGFGGDNGGTGADAQGFGDWFTQALAQEAASRGYAFNPAAAGTSIRVGGYDNFSRRGETPGGYFYDLAAPGATFGGSPENYALRPGGLLSGGGIAGWDGGAFGPQQANAFTTNVLADLVARGVYAPAGQSGPDLGQIAGTFGADYGFYTPGASFEDALAARNWYIGTHLAQQQENARLAAAQQALIASQPTPGQYDWSGNNPNQMGYWNEGQFFPTENPYATPAGYVPVVDTSGG